MRHATFVLLIGCAGGPTVAPTSPVSVIVEPGDSGRALIAAIAGATQSVHVTMYLLSDHDIEDALVDKAQAGLDVRVVLDAHDPSGTAGPLNDSAYRWLSAHGIETRWAPDAFALTHEKCVIIDGAEAWIMTMNAAHASLTDNREFLAVDRDASDVAEAEAIFEADYAGQSFTPSGALVVSPVNARARIVALIGMATASIDLEGEELTDDAVVSGLCAAQTAGVRVRIIVAAMESATLKTLESCSIPVVTLTAPYVHAKAIVVDGETAYVGSVNFSAASMDHNRELGVMTTSADAVRTVASTVAADIAAAKPIQP